MTAMENTSNFQQVKKNINPDAIKFENVRWMFKLYATRLISGGQLMSGHGKQKHCFN